MIPVTIFVVDPDCKHQRTVCDIARELKCQAVVYSSAEECLRVQQRQDALRFSHLDRPQVVDGPSCVVLELSLPGMNGLALQQRLCERHPGAPVIIITDSAEPQAIRTALKQGALDVLVKPLARVELLELLSDTIQLARRSHELDTVCAATATGLQTLTKCERKVLKLLLSGSHTKAIATRLGTSEHTVRHQRGSLHRKCGVGGDVALLLGVLATRLREERVTWPLISVLCELLGDQKAPKSKQHF